MEQKLQYKEFSITGKHKEGLIYYLSFFVWPFGLMLAALRNWKKPWAKNVFWLFCIFFGLTFIIAKAGGADSDRYARTFLFYAHSSDFSLGELLRSFYSEGSNYVDIASPLITFLVSRISDNPKLLFTVFGLIFGYFYSRNIWYLLNRIIGKITIVILLYILAFALFIPIWNINGFRMWTAAQIFLYGTLPFLLDGNRKRLFWSVISVLFHFSFLFPVTILFFFLFLKNRLTIYMIFFILTSFIKEIDLQQVRSFLLILPDIFLMKVSNYTNPQYAEGISISRQALNWYIPFSQIAIKWIIYTSVVFIYLFGRKMLKDRPDILTLFSYSLLFYGFANISSLVPSGGRFLIVANTFMFTLLIIFITTFSKIRGLFLLEAFSLPLLLLFCIVAFRIGIDYYGLMTLMGNPITATMNIDFTPLISFFK